MSTRRNLCLQMRLVNVAEGGVANCIMENFWLVVIVPSADYDDWLGCKDREGARTHLLPYPAELMAVQQEPKAAVAKQYELF